MEAVNENMVTWQNWLDRYGVVISSLRQRRNGSCMLGGPSVEIRLHFTFPVGK